jgi:hypothetical protein
MKFGPNSPGLPGLHALSQDILVFRDFRDSPAFHHGFLSIIRRNPYHCGHPVALARRGVLRRVRDDWATLALRAELPGQLLEMDVSAVPRRPHGHQKGLSRGRLLGHSLEQGPEAGSLWLQSGRPGHPWSRRLHRRPTGHGKPSRPGRPWPTDRPAEAAAGQAKAEARHRHQTVNRIG